MAEPNKLEQIAANFEAARQKLAGSSNADLREWAKDMRATSREMAVASTPSPLELTYSELVENRPLFDRVARAVSIELDVEYVRALEELDRWHSAGGPRDSGEVTLATALEVAPVSADALSRDVKRLELADLEQEEAVAADRAGETVDAVVDDLGQVRFSDEVDRARLLTDPYELAKAYLEACDLDDAYRGEEGRHEFERDFRTQVEAGVDYIATLRHRQEEEERKGERARAQRVRAHQEERERRERARRRQDGE
jgi:hypothetical protein